MKRYLALLLSGLLLLCAACGDVSSQPSEADPIRVGVLTDGDAIDRGINQQIWNALESLTEEGLPLQRAYRIPGTDGGYSDCIAALAAEGCELILCAQGGMSDVIQRAAQSYPDLQFVIVEGETADKNNVSTLTFASEQAAYLAGVAAGKTTQSGRVACVHGRLTEETEQMVAAFMAGVRAADDEVIILRENILGQYDGGDSAAEMLVTKGVDVIFHADRTEQSAVIAACARNGIRAIGAWKDRSGEGAETVLTSAVHGVAVAVQDVVRDYADGSFTAGVRRYDVSRQGVDLVLPGLLSDKTQNSVNNAKTKLAAGETTVPKTLEALGEMYPDLAQTND